MSPCGIGWFVMFSSSGLGRRIISLRVKLGWLVRTFPPFSGEVLHLFGLNLAGLLERCRPVSARRNAEADIRIPLDSHVHSPAE